MNTEIEQHVGSLSLEFVEGLLADYLQNPDSVPPDWRSYFDDMTRGNSVANGETHDAPSRSPGNGDAHGNGNGHNHAVTQIGPSFRPASLFGRPVRGGNKLSRRADSDCRNINSVHSFARHFRSTAASPHCGCRSSSRH